MNDDGTKNRERAFWRAYHPGAEPEWHEPWPTESRGNGVVVKNNRRTGAAQGKSSLIRKAHCRLCGFPNDLSRVDHSGGSLDGDGAGGEINSVLESAPVTGGGTHTEYAGEQAYRTNAGCSLCLSKNSSLMRVDVASIDDPWSRISPLGF